MFLLQTPKVRCNVQTPFPKTPLPVRQAIPTYTQTLSALFLNATLTPALLNIFTLSLKHGLTKIILP